MLKRKAHNGNNKTTGSAGAKKPRAESLAAKAGGIDPPASAQVQPGLVADVAMQTSKLAQAIDSKGQSFSLRMRSSVADPLKVDAAQVKSRIGLSLMFEGDEVRWRKLVIDAVCMCLGCLTTHLCSTPCENVSGADVRDVSAVSASSIPASSTQLKLNSSEQTS
jgi:hypothetical protein